jgi:predicted phosphate transport protein (TIGR00153 family)
MIRPAAMPIAHRSRKWFMTSVRSGLVARFFVCKLDTAMLRWFRSFLPKEERFFDLFARHSQTIVQGAQALQGMLKGGEDTPVFCRRVSQLENDADGITREVLTAVRRTFITPFDRVDIKNLITSMDDAIDQMQQTAKAVVLFEVRSFEPPMREIGALIVECANLVGRALPLLESISNNVAMLTAITEELGKLEGRVDDLHDIGLKELFLKHRNANAMDFIVGVEIYDHLEKVADRFDDVANEISSIVIEQV